MRLVGIARRERRAGETVAALRAGEKPIEARDALKRLRRDADLGQNDPPQLPHGEADASGDILDAQPAREQPDRGDCSAIELDRADPGVDARLVSEPARAPAPTTSARATVRFRSAAASTPKAAPTASGRKRMPRSRVSAGRNGVATRSERPTTSRTPDSNSSRSAQPSGSTRCTVPTATRCSQQQLTTCRQAAGGAHSR